MNDGGILVGKGEDFLRLPLSVGNRHGLIAGATGTGKTATLRVLAEGYSAAGVPVFLADVKGDLGGLSAPGEPSPRIADRARTMGIDWKPQGLPVVFWDLFGTQGHPIRATVSDMGPLLLSRLLGLNDVQEGVLNVVFRYADEEGLLLLDLKDLRALLAHVGENAKDLTLRYGNVAVQSIGAIQRELLALENQGGAGFFGEPALMLTDLIRTDQEGRGLVNVLAADRLMQSPRLYATFLLWMLAELFEELPEVGDLDRPKLVFFFDEAHLLFSDASKEVTDQVEQVVRLIRSKGVGVYFISQSPLDIPDDVLAQLGHRIQHALRAFTPRDQKAVRAVAETFRPNPKVDAEQAVQALGVGEALVSLLDEKGVPAPVQQALIAPPATKFSPITAEERSRIIAASPHGGRFEQVLDRESAYERLTRRVETPPAESKVDEREQPDEADEAPVRRGGRQPQGWGEMVAKEVGRSIARGVGSRIGREIVRGIFGALLRGK